jgi:hypothetical protein
MFCEFVTMEGKVTLSKKELKRLTVLIRAGTGEITARQAAEVMVICLRHERRLLAAYNKEGAAALGVCLSPEFNTARS